MHAGRRIWSDWRLPNQSGGKRLHASIIWSPDVPLPIVTDMAVPAGCGEVVLMLNVGVASHTTLTELEASDMRP